MSALARYYHHRGWRVSGYDKTETQLTRKLVDEGLTISFTADTTAVPSTADLYVYTPAVPDDFILLTYIKNLGHKVYKRSEVLGRISSKCDCIAIAGTHGKTTTAAIIAHVLRELGADPTALIGGVMKNYDSNYLHGSSELLVVEADEYDRSFLQLLPDTAVITTVDPDHLDIYGTEKEMRDAYRAFAQMLPQSADLYLHESVDISDLKRPAISYGKKGDFRLLDLKYSSNGWKMLLADVEGQYACTWQMPGEHNAMNALAAFAVLRKRGYSAWDIMAGLETMEGIGRRYDVWLDGSPALVMDYAHHPTELNAAISTARMQYGEEAMIHVIFQPHLYSRTRDFYKEFALELDKADMVWITEIYPARELPINGVSEEMIVNEMELSDVSIVKSTSVSENIANSKADVILILGAGDLDQQMNKIKAALVA